RKGSLTAALFHSQRVEREQHRDRDEREHARLEAARSAGHPRRSGEAHVEKPLRNLLPFVAGIRRAEDVERDEIERGVKSDREPETAGRANREAEEEREESDGGRVDPVLHRLREVVEESERDGERDRRRPESDAARERVQRVAAKCVLLKEA